MRGKMFLVGLCVLSSLLLGATSSDKQRIATTNAWIGAAKDVAKKYGNDLAKSTAVFLEKHGVISKPEGVRCIPLEQKQVDSTKGVSIITVMSGDLSQLFVRRNFDVKNFGMFEKRRRYLFLNDTLKLTPKTRGITLLHETLHARQRHFVITEASDQALCTDEYDAFRMVDHLRRSMGGKIYADLVEKEVRKFQAQQAAQGRMEFRTDLYERGLDGRYPVFRTVFLTSRG